MKVREHKKGKFLNCRSLFSAFFVIFALQAAKLLRFGIKKNNFFCSALNFMYLCDAKIDVSSMMSENEKKINL
jgi:hypothetical protein